MPDFVYVNRRGEMVMPGYVFGSLKYEAVMKAVEKPYPQKTHHSRKKQRPKTQR